MKRQKDNAKGTENDLLEPTPASAEALFSNEDLLVEILLRVPAKSLIRFKCVSKYWLGLVSDPQFGYNHTAHNRESISALYFHLGSFVHDRLKSVSLRGHQSLPTLSFLNGVETNWTITVRHACNGLMLCSYGWPEKYIVCNLTTQKYIILSQPTQIEDGSITLCSLAYDPAISPYYKVVSIWELCFGSNVIYIYSSEKSSWTHLHALADPPMNLTAFCNGAIHWMSLNEYYFRFQVDTEKLTKTLMPSEPRILYGRKIKFFGECGGDLLLIQYASPYVVGLRILQMEMETSCWILKQRVSLRPIAHAFPNERIRFYLLTVLKGSREGDIVPILLIEGKVIAYYPWSKTFKVICYTPDGFSCLEYLQKGGAYQYFESLSPV